MQSVEQSSSLFQSTNSPPTSISSQNILPVIVLIRRSSRSHQQPHYLKDYFYGMIHSSQLPAEHHALVSTLIKYTEPQSYEEASKELEWVEVMRKEIDALIANQTWDYVDLPPEKRAISNKWVYKVKLKLDGTLERLKARLVIRGFTQKYGIEYREVFHLLSKWQL